MATTELTPRSEGGEGLRSARGFGGVANGWNQFWRLVGHYLPKRLYARSLIIVIAPMILLQSVIAFVFMERHWATVTQRLSQAVTRDIAAIIDIIETYPHGGDYSEIIRIAQERMALRIDVLPPDPLPPPGPKPFFSILDQTLSAEIISQINRPFWIDTVGNSKIVEIRIKMPENVLRVFARRSQTYASNTHIFLMWMVGTSLVLLIIAIPFLRNQIKPILQLAEAAESFGKGRPTADFRPRGAEEVRRAGRAFLQMRERIERQIEQRTAMLTGVSHDLRTILTRFRLQLAVAMPDKAQADALNKDIDDMQSMLEDYLAFAKGEAAEDTGSFDLEAFFAKLSEEASLRKRRLSTTIAGEPEVKVRPNAFARLLDNLIGNAFRYAGDVTVAAEHGRGTLTVTVDDDGPGIPPDKREHVFKPFVRLDEARNQDAGGTGLGLAIARDIARSHGGDIVLSDSPLGGLRAVVRVPA